MKVGPGNNTEEVDSPLGMDVHEAHLHSTKRSNTEGPLDVAHIRNTAETFGLLKPRRVCQEKAEGRPRGWTYSVTYNGTRATLGGHLDGNGRVDRTKPRKV